MPTNFYLLSRFGTPPPAILSTEGILGIYQLSTSEPNSAGGVDVEIQFANFSEKEIKYITFTVTPYNATENVWYNSDIRYIKLNAVAIDYMDGTSLSLKVKE